MVGPVERPSRRISVVSEHGEIWMDGGGVK
jgi:hypothetical protein